MNRTLSYYNKNADAFVSDTGHVDFSPTAERFLKELPPGGSILDFGCGSGRDTKYFLDKGYRVTAVDGSEELCARASGFTGIEVRQMLFRDLDEREKYDGIWACASILHVPAAELPDVIRRMCRALKPDGVMYMSFKYGSFSGMRGGRYFSDFTEQSFCEMLERIQSSGEGRALQLGDRWISRDVRPGRGEERWLNILLRKTNAR